MRLRNAGLRTKMLAGYTLPLVLVVLLGLVAWISIDTIVKDVRWTDFTHNVIHKAGEMSTGALDMQRSMRGYLLSGKEEYLDPYKTAFSKERIDFASIKNAISENQTQVKLIEDAKKVLDSWKTSVAEPLIALRREVGDGKDMNDIGILVGEGRGKKYFDKFRNQTKTFIDREQKLLGERMKKSSAETDPVRLRDSVELEGSIYLVIIRAHKILGAAVDMETGTRGYLLAGEKEFLEPYESGKKRLFNLMEKQKRTVSDNPEQVRLLTEMRATLNDWITKVVEPSIALRRQITRSKTMADVNAVVDKGEGKKIFDQYRAIMREFVVKEKELLKEREEVAHDTEARAKVVLLAGTGIIILLSLLIAYLLARNVTGRVRKAMGLAEAIGRGDLTGTLEVKENDEVGILCKTLNATALKLRNQIGKVLDGVNVVTQSAAEISATVTQVVINNTQTSTAVTQTSTTVEEVKQSATMASERARSVAEASEQAVRVSTEGQRATQDTASRMDLIKEQMETIGETVIRLSEHSQAIEDIVGTVQDLADQSNLLAVNASIEAARAGDQGKGFAVVAHEIKTLSDQSKEATDQIRNILGDTRKWISAVVMATEQGGKAVDSGIQQSKMAGEAISALAGSVSESSQAVAVIRASSEQQSQGVDQVAGAMASIETAVHQNLAGVNQLRDMSDQLNTVGNSLSEVVDAYKV